MKQIIKFSIIIVILFLCFKATAWSNSSELIAISSTKALQMEISLAATQFLLAERVLLQVKIKNIGSEPIRLPSRSSDFLINPSGLKYTIEGPKPPNKLRYPEADVDDWWNYPDEENSRLLEPGGEETVTTDLVKCSIAATGHYKIKVEYEVPPLKPLVPPFFLGKLTASLEFDVLEPTGEDADFLRAMQEWFVAQKIEPERRCYSYIGERYITCSDELYRKHSTSRIATWILINQMVLPHILLPKNSLKSLRYGYRVVPEYLCDLASPGGKRRVKNPNDMTERLLWENETIDDIIALHPSAPFSAFLAIQRALNTIALGDKSKGLNLMRKFIRACDDRNIVSRECEWAKEFIELWNKKRTNKIN